MWDKVVKNLLKNTPLALVVIGLALLVLGATGGFDKLGIQVESSAWRIVLAVMGIVVAGFGGLLLWRGPADIESSALAKDCDLKITSPDKNSSVDEKIVLKGTYKEKPPRKRLAVLEFSPSSGRYWFKKPPPLYDEKEKEWSFSDLWVGGERNGQPGEDRIFYLAFLGESGQALKDYYLSVREKFDKPVPIETLTPDISLGDHVKVRRKP